MKMENKELINRISGKLGRNKTDVKKLLDAFVGVVKNRSSELDSIAIPGFGTFETRKRAERLTVLPGSGKRLLVPPRVVLSFKVSNVLKSKLK